MFFISEIIKARYTTACLVAILVMGLSDCAQSQFSIGLQTGKFHNYWGSITRPGIGFYSAYRVQVRPKFKLNYQISFMHTPGKYEKFPMDPGTLNEGSNFYPLKYLSDLRVNSTLFDVHACFILFQRERILLDLNLGLSLGFAKLKYQEEFVYANEAPIKTKDTKTLFGTVVSVGCEYILTDAVSLRLEIGEVLSTTMALGEPMNRFSISTGIVLNQNN